MCRRVRRSACKSGATSTSGRRDRRHILCVGCDRGKLHDGRDGGGAAAHLGVRRARSAGMSQRACLRSTNVQMSIQRDHSAILRTCVISTDVQLSIQCFEHQAFVLLFGVVLKSRSLRIIAWRFHKLKDRSCWHRSGTRVLCARTLDCIEIPRIDTNGGCEDEETVTWESPIVHQS